MQRKKKLSEEYLKVIILLYNMFQYEYYYVLHFGHLKINVLIPLQTLIHPKMTQTTNNDIAPLAGA